MPEHGRAVRSLNAQWLTRYAADADVQDCLDSSLDLYTCQILSSTGFLNFSAKVLRSVAGGGLMARRYLLFLKFVYIFIFGLFVFRPFDQSTRDRSNRQQRRQDHQDIDLQLQHVRPYSYQKLIQQTGRVIIIYFLLLKPCVK